MKNQEIEVGKKWIFVGLRSDICDIILQFDAAEVQEVREKIIAIRDAYRKANEVEVGQRWTFEEGVSYNSVR